MSADDDNQAPGIEQASPGEEYAVASVGGGAPATAAAAAATAAATGETGSDVSGGAAAGAAADATSMDIDATNAPATEGGGEGDQSIWAIAGSESIPPPQQKGLQSEGVGAEQVDAGGPLPAMQAPSSSTQAKPKTKPASTGEAAVLEESFVEALAGGGKMEMAGAGPRVGGFKTKPQSSVSTRSVTQLPTIHHPRQHRDNNTLRSTHPQPSSHQRSQMGVQADSNKRSEPALPFNRSDRFIENVVISKSHARFIPPPNNPGPGYYETVGLGSHAENLRKSHMKRPHTKLPPVNGIANGSKVDGHQMGGGGLGGGEPRFHIQNLTTRLLAANPGPGEYRLNTPHRELSTSHPGPTINFSRAQRTKQPAKGFEVEFYGTLSPGPIYLPNEEHYKHGGKAGFGKAFRSLDPDVETVEERRTAAIPGPNAYNLQARMDGVHGSKQHAPVGTKFGSEARDKVVSLTAGQAEKLYYGIMTEMGPAGYNITGSTMDHISSSRLAPSIGFGKGTRFTKNTTATPGPGSYCV